MNLLFSLFFSTLISGSHNFHVSIANGEYNDKTQSLQLYVKIFSNDLEDAVNSSFNTSISLGNPDEITSADSLISLYVLRHFLIKTEGNSPKLKFIGKEIEQDIVFIYLELPLKSKVNELTVTNTLFFDRFDDQSNIVNLEIDGKLKSIYLESSTPSKTVVFD